MDCGLFLEFSCREGMTEHDAFAECFTLVDEAEACGVDSVWLAEYHFSSFSVLSSPITIASAIAARTRRIRIGSAVVLLPLGHPIRIAEEIATLDHISQGRVEFGIGRGTFPDTHDGYNSPFAESRERFDEYLQIILQAWTMERFSFEGRHFTIPEVRVIPKPLQRPHPPLYVVCTSPDTIEATALRGLPMPNSPLRGPIAKLARQPNPSARACRKAGRTTAEIARLLGSWGSPATASVAPTAAQPLAEAKAAGLG